MRADTPDIVRSAVATLTSRLALLFVASLLVVLLAGCGMKMRHQTGAAPSETSSVQPMTPEVGAVSWSRDLGPILMNHCADCHGGIVGLWVDDYDSLMAGSGLNDVITPGDPDSSLLVRRIKGELQPRMPLNGPPLSDPIIEMISAWIRQGALNN